MQAARVTCYFRDVVAAAVSVTFRRPVRWVFGANREGFREGNIMASGAREPSTGHDAELDELLDSKG